MTDCDTMQEKLQEYLDNQLPAIEAKSVENHLAQCASCRESLKLLRQVDKALGTFPVLDEPANFTTRIMTHIHPTPPSASDRLPATFYIRWEDLLVGFAFALTMTALLYTFYQLLPEDLASPSIVEETFSNLYQRSVSFWHLIRSNLAYTFLGMSSLGTVLIAVISTVILVSKWPWRTIKALHHRRKA